MRLFALKGTDRLGGAVAEALGTEPDPHEERDFEDGEHKARPLVSVRGKDVYVLHGLAGEAGTSANDKLVKLLLFIATCRENGAARVTGSPASGGCEVIAGGRTAIDAFEYCDWPQDCADRARRHSVDRA